MLLRWTVGTSTNAKGEVVRVPRSRTEQTPRIFSEMVELGISSGGEEAASANGSDVSSIFDRGSDSIVVRSVRSVPPLAPEVLIIIN